MKVDYKILTPLTYDCEKGFKEVYDLVNEPSLTIPDETLSIQEMLYRFTNGIVDFEMRNAIYDDDNVTIDDDVNPVNDCELSLSDIHEKMQYHYRRYQDMIELEKQKHEEESSAKVLDTKKENEAGN